jgi:hypothetical protein
MYCEQLSDVTEIQNRSSFFFSESRTNCVYDYCLPDLYFDRLIGMSASNDCSLLLKSLKYTCHLYYFIKGLSFHHLNQR